MSNADLSSDLYVNDIVPKMTTATGRAGASSILTRPKSTLTFLSLPLELRTNIYEYAFAHAYLEIDMTSRPPSLESFVQAIYATANRTITFTSKQIKVEASPILHARTFIVITSPLALRILQPSSHTEDVFAKSLTAKLVLDRPMVLKNLPNLASFSALRLLDIEKVDMHLVDRTRDGTPPFLEQFAARYCPDIFNFAERKVYYSPHGREATISAMQLSDKVQVRTRLV